MQNAVHKMDTSSRYGGNDTSASSHGSFAYRSSNGPHNESIRVPNPNVSYHGANFTSPSDKYGCEANSDNGNVESPYSGWQNMNSSANNNWNGEGKPVGRSIHGGNSAAKDDNNMMVDNDSSSFSGLIGATGGSDNFSEEKSSSNFSSRPPQMPRMGLLGGGESSIMPPSANWSGSQGPTSTSSTWGNRQSGSSEMGGDSNAGTPTKPNSSASWAQAAGKGLSPGTPVPEGGPIPEPQPPTQREKEAQEMRMRAATAQGWGPQAVNQDTPWEVDEPPTEGGKDPMWRPPINNGTEIWENALRISKGIVGPPQTPVPTTVAPPWGHTPATNIGGHWGDDESSSSTWGGGNGGPGTANWQEQGGTSGASSMFGGSVSGDKQQWSGNRSSWGDGNNPEPAPWSARNPPPQQLANWSPAATPKKEMSGGGWEPPSPPPVRRAPPSVAGGGGNGGGGGGGNYDDGTSAWGNPGRQGKVSHWKDMPSAKPIMNANGNMMMPGMPPPGGPGMIRLPGQGGKPGDWSKPPPGRGTNWQEMPPHRDSPTIGSWNEDNGQMKNMGGPGQYGWSNDQGNNPACWGAKPKSGANWADGQVDTSSWLGPAKQRSDMPLQGWSEEMSDKNNLKNDSRKDWTEAGPRPYEGFVGRKLKGGKPLCKDIVHASKQFRVLTEYGYRKEDVENALRNNNMSLDDAAAELHAMSSGAMDVDGFGGRKVRPANVYDEMPDHNMDSFNPNNFHGPNNFQNSLNFSGFKQQPPKTPGGMQQQLSPALIQKLLQQQQQQQQQSLQLMNLNNVQPIGNHKFTTNAQLRHLVQQIQMAVQAGHLNAQILNQPLAPTTLQLLYQLLQQIKALSSLHQIQQVHQTNSAAHLAKGANALQTNVQIAQAKGRIANLQNQICAQQALFLKQQQLPPQQQQPIQPHHGGVPPTPDIFKPDAMPGLHSDFRDLTLKDMSHHQSRLNQWKLSSMDKDDNPIADMGPASNSADFSRAPGPLVSKSATVGSSMHPLLEQGGGDVGTWTGLTGRDSGWPDSSGAEVGNGPTLSSTLGGNQAEVGKEGPTSTSGGSSYLTDLVPEFEPGKPWKGTQMKNIEDDPHITPGSIARSPLSVNNIKDSNLFWPSKTSPSNSSSDVPSSTWGGYNPQGGNSSSSSMKPGKTSWSPDFTTESWGSLPSSKSRNNPPPGLPSTTQGWDRQYNATFLILKNLTPQIDGSTLKTLCMQHGPLQMFHLFLSRGVALVRYSSPEEARKAQSALDNCVLSNTTMLADIPSETEIQQYLQVSSGQGGGGSNGGAAGNNSWPATNGTGFYSSSGTASTGANWNNNVPATSQLWSFSNSSLWGSAQPSNEHDGSTNPISYLPNDLLGGEPI